MQILASGIPPEWQWAGFFLSVVAFVLAMITAPQVLWGRPRIRAETAADSNGLRCQIYNLPPGPIVRLLASREGTDIGGAVFIFRTPGMEKVAEFIPLMKMVGAAGPAAARTFLPATRLGYVNVDLVWLRDGVALTADGIGTPVVLPPDLNYMARISIEYGGRHKGVERAFAVTSEGAYWR